MRLTIPEEELMSSGHKGCQGCGGVMAMRYALKALGRETIVVIPACCWTVLEGEFPYTCLRVPLLHTAFETAASASSGVRAALKARGKDDVTVMAWAGDGGTFDIGIQALSGALERQTNFIYICYNNQIYSNTGIQRSGATPYAAWTTTTVGGKREFRKEMGEIVLAHHIPYAAQACISYPEDLFNKVRKAKDIKGPKYIEILAPCPPGWRFAMEKTVEMGSLAVETGAWALYEFENEKMTFNGRSKLILEKKIDRKPIEEWIRYQGRFRHLFAPIKDDKSIKEIQDHVDRIWDRYRSCYL